MRLKSVNQLDELSNLFRDLCTTCFSVVILMMRCSTLTVSKTNKCTQSDIDTNTKGRLYLKVLLYWVILLDTLGAPSVSDGNSDTAGWLAEMNTVALTVAKHASLLGMLLFLPEASQQWSTTQSWANAMGY